MINIKNKKILYPILGAVITAAFLSAAAFFYFQRDRIQVLPPLAAAEKVINFINENMLQEGMTASLVEVREMSGIYEADIKVGEESVTIYFTKDGSLLFDRAFNLNEELPERIAEEDAPVYDEAVLAGLANCLKDKGVVFYGAHWCGFCTKQKDLFGAARNLLPYVECAKEGNQMAAKCEEEGITVFPTWKFPEQEELVTGFKSVAQLAELSGCPI